MRRWWQLRESWLSLFLLLLMVWTVTRSIQQGDWIGSLQSALGLLFPAAMVGLAAGFLLAWMRWFPRVLAHIVGLAGGVAWIIQLSGSLQAVQIPRTSQTVAYLHPALDGWKDLAIELLIRSLILGRTFFRGSAGEDVVLFVVVLGLVFWIIGFLGAWFAFRSHWPWAAVALPATVLLLNMVYGPDIPARYFHYFTFLSLVFLITYLWKRLEVNWQKDQVRFPQELPQGVFWTGVVFSAVLVLGTAFLPTTAASKEAANFWEQYLQPWREVKGTWERLFSDVGSLGEGRLRGYASTFALGGARTSPSGTAFELKTNRNEYLRGITFDQYDGRGWTNTAGHEPAENLPAHAGIPINRLKRTRVVQTITPRLQGGSMIFAIAEPMSLTIPAVIELGTPAEVAEFEDIVALHTRTSLAEGYAYGVTSLLPVADKQSLRTADQDYPDWVRQRYLQLPDSLPQRVYDLGEQILTAELPPTATVDSDSETASSPLEAGLITPYDAAEAIQSYLRSELVYRDDISAPPVGRDVVDYFLFESKAGYCDYFGSAMVVLLRTQGIPARVVRGYATGEYDDESKTYFIPVSAAHTWAEVYFPRYGWQRFEPTPADYTTMPVRPERPPESGGEPDRRSSAEIDIGEDDLDSSGSAENEDRPEEEGPTATAGRLFRQPAVLVPMIVLLLGAATVAAMSFWAGRGLRQLGPVAATYERMCRWAEMAGATPQGQPTPFEYAEHLAQVLPEHRPKISLITTHYVRERFGHYHLPAQEIAHLQRAWKELRWPIWGRLPRNIRPRSLRRK